MRYTIPKSLLAVFLITVGLMSSASVSADVIVDYDFVSGLAATTVSPDVTAGDFSVGTGLGSNGGRSGSGQNLYARTSATASTLSAAMTEGDYFSFTVTPDSNMDLTSLVLDVGFTKNGSQDGNLTVSLLTSVDNFATAVDAHAIDTTGYPSGGALTLESWTIDLSAAQIQNISTATEFRLYLHDDVHVNDLIHRIDNVVLNGTVLPQTQSALSIDFDSSAHPVSIKSRSGAELLDGTSSDGFYLLEADATKRRFDTVTDLGDGEYKFGISGSSEQLSVRFVGVNDYLTARFTSLSGFALNGERLYFDLDTVGDGLRVHELDYMMSAASSTTSVSIERVSLWETTIPGAFALYEYVDNDQEDETLLDLWTMEGLPHPKVDGVWDRAAAEAWLDDWIVESTDSSYLNMEPNDFAEHSAFIPYAKKMDATAMYLWNIIWRGEYQMNYRQNDEINPAMYPNGLSDMLAFKSEAAAQGLGLMFHYLSGNIGEHDPEFCYPNVHPDLQSWGTLTLNAPIDASASSFTVVPDAGVEMPVIGTDIPIYAPPVVSSVFTFKTFRIGNEWIQATTVTDLGNGTWQLDGVSRGKWSTSAAGYAADQSLCGYLQAYGDFVPDPNSALLETIATRWANLNNTLDLRHGSFDGIEQHKAYGPWGMEKFGAHVYENLDHPTSSDSSTGVAPKAWIEYKFNRVKDALGGNFKPFGGCAMFLGDESRATVSLEECEYALNRSTSKNARAFAVTSYDGVSGVTLETLEGHGLTPEVLTKVKSWKHASHAMDSTQRTAMEEWVGLPSARRTLNGNYSYSRALWRLSDSLIERWFALGTDIYTGYWHFGQEHGTITPRFYLHNGDVQTLDVPSELNSGADRVRIVGRVLPRYDSAAAGNIDLMTYLGGSPLTVSGTNSTGSAVWTDTEFTSYAVSPSLDLAANRGIGLWVTGDGSGANLVIRLTQSEARDYVVPLNFTDRRWIEIPFGEAAWRVRDWGWTKSTRKLMDYSRIKSIQIGIGHIPASTSSSVLVEDLTALSETHEALVNPTLTLGGQTVSVNGSIDCENHFILDEDGLFTVYDAHWNALSEQQLAVLLPSSLTTFKMESASSSSGIWLEVGVQASNETTTNPDPTPSFVSDPITKVNAVEDAVYSASIAGDATDPAAAPMIFSKLDGPAWLSVASDGSLSGTPTPMDVGLNAFTVQVGTTNGSDTATLNITVDNNGVNDAPGWYSNPVVEATATEGMAYSSGLADDVSDFDAGASLTYTKVSGPAWLSVASDGTLSGTPSNSDLGANTWTVSVSDGIAAPVTATLNIGVTQRHEAEDAVRYDSTTSTYTAGYTGSGYAVMTTDGSSYIEWTVNVASAAPGELSFRHLTDDDNVMTLSVNGLVVNSSYVLGGTGGAWGMSRVVSVSLNAGSNTIRLTRDSGPDSVRVDHLSLDVFNNAPVFTVDPINEANAIDGFGYSGSVANATDAEGDTLTYSKLTGPAWLVVGTDGSLSGTPALSDAGTNVFTVGVDDGKGGSDTATLNITVLDQADFDIHEAEDAVHYDSTTSTYTAGYTGSGYVVMTTAGSSYIEWTVNLAAAASGELSFHHLTDEDNVMTLSVNGLVVNSSYVLNGTGGAWGMSRVVSVSFNAGSNTIRLMRDSGPNHVRMDHLYLSVEGVSNAAPTFTVDPINEANATENLAYSGSVANATDADGDPLTYSKLTGPAWLTVAADGSLSGTPAQSDAGANVFTVEVADGNGGTDSATLNITVDAVNDAPTFTVDPINEANATENLAYSGSVANATDADGDPLTYSKVTGPAWLSVAADGSLFGTPGDSDVGANAFTVQVSDGKGGSDSAALNITVDEFMVADQAVSGVQTLGTSSGTLSDSAISDDVYQVLTESGDPSALEYEWTFNVFGGELVTFYVEAYHTANSEGDNFVFAYSTNGTDYTEMGAVVDTVDDDTASWFALPSGLSGTVYVRVEDTDRTVGNNVADSLYIDEIIIVSEDSTVAPNAANTPLPADGSVDVAIDQDLAWTAGAMTVSHDVYFGTNPAPGGAEFQGNQSGTTFDPGTLAYSTTYYWTIDEVNQSGTTAGPVWSFTTAAPGNTAPRFASDPVVEVAVSEDAAYAATLADDASDVDGDPLSFSKLSGPAWLNVASDGTLSGTPTSSDLGLNSWTVSVSDGNGGSDTATLEINVEAESPSWTELINDNFEGGWGNWRDGGSDARLSRSFAIGSQCFAIQDDTSTSNVQLINSLDLSGYSELKIEFSYIVQSFEKSEAFWVRFSDDGGSSWSMIKAYVNDVDFVDDGTRYPIVLTIDSGSYTFSNNVLIRFQCDASGNGDDVYIDSVIISAQ